MQKAIRAVLIDLSGTLHVDYKAIPGAVEALKKLRTTGVRIKFVTNTTAESKRTLYEHLKKMGYVVEQEEIHSPLTAARSLIDKEKLKPMFLISPVALEDFEASYELKDKPNAVVVGFSPKDFHYAKLNDAFRCLLTGAKLIGIHAGKSYTRKDGVALGLGCFVKGLEYASQREARLVGKPTAAFFTTALGNIPPAEAVMIGDDVTDDVQGALNAGLRAYMVQTGTYQKGNEKKLTKKLEGLVPSFVEAVDKIKEQFK